MKMRGEIDDVNNHHPFSRDWMSNIHGFFIVWKDEIIKACKVRNKKRHAKKMAVLYALKYPAKRQFRIEVKPGGIDSIGYNVQYRYIAPGYGEGWTDYHEYDSESKARNEIKELKMGDLEEQIRKDKSTIEYINC